MNFLFLPVIILLGSKTNFDVLPTTVLQKEKVKVSGAFKKTSQTGKCRKYVPQILYRTCCLVAE
jgi:hypothetical protein